MCVIGRQPTKRMRPVLRKRDSVWVAASSAHLCHTLVRLKPFASTVHSSGNRRATFARGNRDVGSRALGLERVTGDRKGRVRGNTSSRQTQPRVRSECSALAGSATGAGLIRDLDARKTRKARCDSDE